MPISSTTKPHRRVLLTQPSAAIAEAMSSETQNGSSNGHSSSSSEGDGRTTRVIAYLSAEEAQQLEAAWLKMRAMAIRPSKADIMRAALIMAIENPDALGKKLLEQMGGDVAPQVLATNGRR